MMNYSCAGDRLTHQLKSNSFDSQDLDITTYLGCVLGRLEGVPAGETAICQVSLIRARQLKWYTVIKSWPGIEKTAVCDRSSQDCRAESVPRTFSHVSHESHCPNHIHALPAWNTLTTQCYSQPITLQLLSFFKLHLHMLSFSNVESTEGSSIPAIKDDLALWLISFSFLFWECVPSTYSHLQAPGVAAPQEKLGLKCFSATCYSRDRSRNIRNQQAFRAKRLDPRPKKFQSWNPP